jgi:hypothetical protein
MIAFVLRVSAYGWLLSPKWRPVTQELRAGSALGSQRILTPHSYIMPIAVAVRSRARTVLARSNTAIVGSNPTEA